MTATPSATSTNKSLETYKAQEMQKNATKVFLDIPRFYKEYIKTEIPFVNYVRDTKLAHVHIMYTQQATGSRGIEHTLTYIGQKNITGLDATLQCVPQQMNTKEMIRRRIAPTITLA